jgi:hypothetical protein
LATVCVTAEVALGSSENNCDSHTGQTAHAIYQPFPGFRLHPASYRKANSVLVLVRKSRTLGPRHRPASRIEKTKSNFSRRANPETAAQFFAAADTA